MNIDATPTWFDVTASLVVLMVAVAFLAMLFVAFIHWSDRVAGADTFADTWIPELEDVAAIEAALPEMRDHAHGRRSGR